VSKATTLNDFDAGTVTLSAAASARPGGSRNDTLLQDTADVDVVLTRAPGMTVSIAVASGQPSIYSSPGVWEALVLKSGPSPAAVGMAMSGLLHAVASSSTAYAYACAVPGRFQQTQSMHHGPGQRQHMCCVADTSAAAVVFCSHVLQALPSLL
jgi:hypothetical protein